MNAKNLVSPYSLALISLFIFIVAWVFPPSLYTYYIPEPDRMFLDFTLIVYYLLCVTGFVVGVSLFIKIRHFKYLHAYSLTVTSPLIFIATPLLISTALCGAFLIYVSATIPNLRELLSSESGNFSRGITSTGIWHYALTVQSGVVWWAARRANQLRLHNLAYQVIWIFGFVLAIITCIVRLDRSNLMPLIVGAALIYLYNRADKDNVSLLKLARSAAYMAGGTLLLFLAIFVMRGAGHIGLLISGLIGYSLASYNRLASVLGGSLHYTYAGSGIYLAPFLSYSTSLPFHTWVGGATPSMVMSTEFLDVHAAGLTAAFNWSSVFGYIFADIGWWTPLYMVVIGLLTGWLWQNFRKGTIWGVVLYPWFAFSILFWFGTNQMFEVHVVILIFVAAILWFYESLFLYRESSEPDLT